MPEIEERRANPREDFISSLLLPAEDGMRLSDEEILATCYLVLIAGHDTTANTIVLGTVALAGDQRPGITFGKRRMPRGSSMAS